MKKILAIILITAMLISGALSLVACDNENSNQKYTVGVCQLIQHDSLDQATQGFIDSLKAELGEENVEIDVQNAAGDTNVCNTIITSFVSKNVDLILANATAALQAAYNATTTIPILGTSITEYGVALGTTLTNDVVGGNVSGTSDLANLDDQAEMILEICPDVKVVGITYCSAEANSLYQVQKVTEYLENKGVTVKAYPFADSNDISAVVTAACAQCDVLYIPTDNTAASCAEIIGNIVRETKTPVFAGEENTVRICGVASLTISYYDLGVTTGKMAAKILKGEADISTMKIEYAPATKKYNKEMCEYLGITVPDDYTEIN
jgi:putative ABC transport system substrate-binding protein